MENLPCTLILEKAEYFLLCNTQLGFLHGRRMPLRQAASLTIVGSRHQHRPLETTDVQPQVLRKPSVLKKDRGEILPVE
jgi:hypothetical protein